MKKALRFIFTILVLSVLSGCLASTDSPIGINCGPSAEAPLWERPLVCQGR